MELQLGLHLSSDREEPLKQSHDSEGLSGNEKKAQSSHPFQIFVVLMNNICVKWS